MSARGVKWACWLAQRAAVALALGGALAASAGAQTLGGSVVGNGGDPVAGVANRIVGTVGQPIIGMTTGPGTPANFATYGFWTVGRSVIVAVPGGLAPPPLAFDRPEPNPAPGRVTLGFSLPAASTVRLAIYDVSGALVRTLVSGEYGAGSHFATWDGRDEAGELHGAGIYFARMMVSGRELGTRRIAMLR